ncbi:MAG: MATE family efflux transporter [Candidatus Izemoplasmatales bacterium]|nr:MATE family efflux transporter [Candidatus Izemoplasmatales bacterium]
MDKERVDLLGKHDVKKSLIILTVPATFAMIVNALYNLVDTIFVGRGVNDIAIGALSIANPVQMIIMAFALMIGIGSASIFSRAFGRRDQEVMRRSVNTAVLMGIVVSIVISILGFVFLDPLLYLFGAREGNIQYAHDYLSIILIGLVPFSLSVIFNNLTRAEGRAKIAMIAMMIGAGVNIVLDPIFIFDWGLGLGVKGAAIATVIANIFSFIYVFTSAISKKSNLNIDLKKIYDVDLSMTTEVASIGFSSFVRNAIGAFLVILVNNLIIYYAGDDSEIYISIFGVVNRLLMFLMMPGFGLIQGLQPLVGFNFGAKLYKRLYDVIKYAKNLMLIYFFGAFIVSMVFAKQLFNLFSEENNPIFMTDGPIALRIVTAGFILVGFQIILSSVYQSMGYPLRAFLVAVSRQAILFIPLVFILTRILGLQGIWFAFMAADLLAGLISLLVYLYEMKDLKKKIPGNMNMVL